VSVQKRAIVVDAPSLDAATRLAAVLDQFISGEPSLGGPSGSDGDRSEVTVVIVPELGAFAKGSPAATDPALVETLIDLLHERGYTNVVVGAGADESAGWAANREAYALVDLLGYRFVTDAGRDYDVVDLSQDLIEAPFERGDVMAGTNLNAAWVDAGLRIVFAANTTHGSNGYHLGLGTVMRVVPEADRMQLSAPPGDVVAELLAVTPVRLTIIDAIESCHGSGGGRAPKPISTNTVIAANDVWTADTIGAIKMGLDPAVSPLFARAPARTDLEIIGSLDVYDGFIAPHPLVLDSMSQLNSSPWLSQLVRPWTQVLDPELFALESPIDATLNEKLAPWFADVDNDPLAFGALVFAGYATGTAQRAMDTYRILYDKDSVQRSDVPLGFDPDSFAPSAYRSIVPELRGLERLLDEAKEHRPRLRWRYLDETVLFDYRRDLPIDFDEFAAAVDVAKTISYMNDYLGGVVVELQYDDEGRSIRQAERNLYLPQPNYLALSGGKPIDVCKLEIVEYGTDRHSLYWKTIASPNDSASYDDGIVTFDRTNAGTAVTIFGRQLFTLPPLWAAIDLGLAPDLKAHLVTDAYATFFDRTLANLEALVEGRDIRIGKPRTATPAPLPSSTLERLAEDALDWLNTMSASIKGSTATETDNQVGEVDDDGFVHFKAEHNGHRDSLIAPVLTNAAGFWAELVDAGLRDLATTPSRTT